MEVREREREREWIWLIGPFELHRNSPQVLNISSIRVFDQISDPQIPIPFALVDDTSGYNMFGL